MTWYAQHIFAQPNEHVLHELRSHPVLAQGVYWVPDLSAVTWYHPSFAHHLPPKGLVVVRPVGNPDDYDTENMAWFGSWYDIIGPPDRAIQIEPETVQSVTPTFGKEAYPPLSFLQYLKALSARTDSVVAYYYCSMWAGVPEIEYAWVFTPEEIAYNRISTVHPPAHLYEFRPAINQQQREADVLVEMLKHFGLVLPGTHFELHTRSFPWEQYKQ